MLKKLRSPLYLALLIPALLVYVGDWFAPMDHSFRNMRSKLDRYDAPADIVVVSVGHADSSRGTSVVSSRKLSDVLTGISRQMPYRVFIDAPVDFGQDVDGDRRLVEAVGQFGRDAALVVRNKRFIIENDDFQSSDFNMPAPAIAGSMPIVVSSWYTNFFDYAISSPYEVSLAGKRYPTLASRLAGVDHGLFDTFVPDNLVDPDTIRTVPATAILMGKFTPGLLTGRTVIVSLEGTVPPIGYYGSGRREPIAIDIAGAAALRKPMAIYLGGIPVLLVTWLLILAASRARRKHRKAAIYVLSLAVILGLPLLAEPLGITLQPSAALFCAMIYGFSRLWQHRIRREQLTNASGLPNLMALGASQLNIGCDVVVAVIARYEEILATLPKDLHGECARQIARRLSVGSGIETVFNGEGGHFAWTEEARPLEMQLDHLEGLRALFSAPLEIGSHKFDTNIHFGLDRNEGLDALTRVNSAVASANDAMASGRAVELFEADRLAEASWELSLHSRIDEGLRNGEIWLAYQTQWDMKTRRPSGVEALIRWSHPTRGPIAPDAFILQAERAGRIDALTYWVLNEAITAGLALNTMGFPLQMSINLSAQMVDKAELVPSILDIVQRRGFDPHQMTIEVTETSSVRNRPAAVSNLSRLRDRGFKLSIDDFGTGEASLAYLADLPSDELKLDRRFVSRILSHDRDHKIVSNTITMAHALGQSVVAEGIEDEATFRLLSTMGCDVGQGYHLGRPQPFADLCQTLLKMGHVQTGIV